MSKHCVYLEEAEIWEVDLPHMHSKYYCNRFKKRINKKDLEDEFIECEHCKLKKVN